MTTPVFLAPPHADGLPPHSYVIQVDRAQCTNCGHIGESCETFAKTHLRAAWGRLVTNLRPLNEPPRYNLPIELINKPLTTIPFCNKCPNPTLVTGKLPFPPADTKPHAGAAFYAAPQPKVPKTAAKKAASLTTTTDDLMKGLDI